MGNYGDMDVMTPDGVVKRYPCVRCGTPAEGAFCARCSRTANVKAALAASSATVSYVQCPKKHWHLNDVPCGNCLPPNPPPPAPPNVLEQAAALVYGDRAKAYGPAHVNHTNIIRMYDAWLEARYPDGVEHQDSYDSCVFNVMQKLSRFAHGLRNNEIHRDSLVDGAGYFGVMGKIADEKESGA